MDNTEKFTGLAEEYRAGRPAYADEFVESLYSEQGFSECSVIADIGSGTGKFAKQLLEKGSTVYGVEPNEDMRSIAAKELEKYGKFYSVCGSDTDTRLPENSVDFITAAQAFHWFDSILFKEECRRILRKGGKVFLIWNMRDMTDTFNQESFEIYSKYCPEFEGFAGGIQKDDVRIREFFDGKYEYREFDNVILYDKDTFISRSMSASYSLKEGDIHYSAYREELKQLFERNAKGKIAEMANKTVVYWGTLKFS
ncbi:class I SAM-dependent methyltransferase [Sellimonas sp.]|uniref:class I SAM-dependent methyltransferase n=1 Tax=Sellimonas sp. TaxID=2021466 RepID=UPI000B387145|nr:class I SAM-dependent methyltransferase [Sellimonas sp.]OUP66593.1 hypothetical protein B5F13_03315 [Drancourtella sp. An177]